MQQGESVKPQDEGVTIGFICPGLGSKDPDVSQVLLLYPMDAGAGGGAKAAVLSEVRGTLSCNQPDTIRLGSGWGCGLTRKGQHDPCHPLLIAMQMYHCFWGI